MHIRLLGCLSLMLLVPATDTPDARAHLTALRAKGKQARESKDWSALQAIAREQAEFLNNSARSLESLALASAQAGDRKTALQALGDFVAMGEADDALVTTPQLDALKGTPEFVAILKRMEQNKTAVREATEVAQFHDAQLVPEDLDYDPQSKTFFVTSVLQKKIVRFGLDGGQSDFAIAPDGWPMMAIRIDAPRGLVWATEAALDTFVSVPAKDWGKSAVLCFRLSDAKLLHRVDGPPHSALGDMVLTKEGDVIVADGEGGGIYRVRHEASEKSDSTAIERLDAGDFISPQTPALHPDGRHLFVPDYLRGIGILDPANKKVAWVQTDRRFTLHGIDGLYFKNGTLIAVQNGTSPERVVSVRLNADLDRVDSETVIERATPTLGDPTHGVVVGDDFFYIANSGWDSLQDDGALKPNAKMTPARLMKAVLKKP
jgi:hypothetical protein